MKSPLALLFIAVILGSCVSTKKLLIQGDYDQVINRSIKKLIKDPNSTEDAQLLDQSYNLANERDYSRAKYLRQEGNPANWDEMFNLFSALKFRQENVRKVMPLHIGSKIIEYPMVDYDAQIIEAKAKASEYYYNDGKRLMGLNNREAYRVAFNQLNRARGYAGGSYMDADRLMQDCRLKGVSKAIVTIQNATIIKLPDNWVRDVLTFNTDGLNSEWVEYHFAQMNNNEQFDYAINVVLQEINISPDQQSDKDYMVKKDVPDGFTYMMDAKGNVRKDTAGNDMKVPKYKNLACTVIETLQQKKATLTGTIEFIILNPQQQLKKEPIGSETNFEWKSARAIGDVGALSPEQVKMTQVKPAAFPNDFEMIGRTTDNIRRAVRDVIYRNKPLIK